MRGRQYRWCLGISSALGSLIMGCSAAAQPADAQEASTENRTAAAEESGTSNEIVVTARRREESLQDIPVAVTVLSGEDLSRHSITTVADISAFTPSLSFQATFYTPFSKLVSLRGQMASELGISQSPSVGIYIDDVYQVSTLGIQSSDLADVSRIEVLKGPQGTLYGRNTTGGAIKIQTNLPELETLSGSIKLDIGNFGTINTTGVLNFPMGNKAAVRIVATRNSNDGYARNVFLDRPLADLDSRTVRGTLLWEPVDSLRIVARANYLNTRSNGQVFDLIELSPEALYAADGLPRALNNAVVNAGLQSGVLSRADYDILLRRTPASSFPDATAYQNAVAGAISRLRASRDLLVPYVRGGRRQNYDFQPPTLLRQWGGNLDITYDLGSDISIQAISGFNHVFQRAIADADATPFAALNNIPSKINVDQFTQELRVFGSALDDALSWTVGYYYFSLSGLDAAPASFLLTAIRLPSQNPQNRQSIFTTKSHSVYAQATYEIIPNLSFTGGLRYTTETQRQRASFFVGTVCGLPAQFAATCEARFKNTADNLSYTAGLDWKLAPNLMVYAKTSRGFKAGGTNQRGTSSGGFNNYKPEVVTDYELGLKTSFADGKARVNVAAFHSDYDDLQRSVLVVTTINGLSSTATALNNAGRATIDGVELEVAVRPVPALTLQATSSYIDAKYKEYSGGPGIDWSDHTFQNTPKWQVSGSATYTVPFDGGEVSATLDYSYRSSLSTAPDAPYAIYSVLPPLSLWNARVGVHIEAFDADIAAYVRNIADKKYRTGSFNLSFGDLAPTGLGWTYAQIGTPRTFGIELTKRF